MRHGRCAGACGPGELGSGGGIASAGTLAVTNSTLSGNLAGVSGGGIFNDGTLTVTNSTLSGNSAADLGGGICNNAGGTADRDQQHPL